MYFYKSYSSEIEKKSLLCFPGIKLIFVLKNSSIKTLV